MVTTPDGQMVSKKNNKDHIRNGYDLESAYVNILGKLGVAMRTLFYREGLRRILVCHKTSQDIQWNWYVTQNGNAKPNIFDIIRR